MTDLALKNGDLHDGSLVGGVDDVVQRCTIALQKFLGEWRLNQLAGCDWLREPRLDAEDAGAIAVAAVAQVTGVSSVTLNGVTVDAGRGAIIRLTINGTEAVINV